MEARESLAPPKNKTKTKKSEKIIGSTEIKCYKMQTVDKTLIY